MDKSKLSVDLKRDVTIAADNEDILNSEFAKIQDEAYQIYFVKNKMNKGQIYQEHNRYKDMGNIYFSIHFEINLILFTSVPFQDNFVTLSSEEGEINI